MVCHYSPAKKLWSLTIFVDSASAQRRWQYMPWVVSLHKKTASGEQNSFFGSRSRLLKCEFLKKFVDAPPAMIPEGVMYCFPADARDKYLPPSKPGKHLLSRKFLSSMCAIQDTLCSHWPINVLFGGGGKKTMQIELSMDVTVLVRFQQLIKQVLPKQTNKNWNEIHAPKCHKIPHTYLALNRRKQIRHNQLYTPPWLDITSWPSPSMHRVHLPKGKPSALSCSME